MIRKIITVVLALMMTVALGACAGSQEQADTQSQDQTQAQTQEESGTQAEEQTQTQDESGTAQEQTQAQDQAGTQAQEQADTPDSDWNLPETTEMTDEVSAVFDKAMEGLMGVSYEPVGFLGEKDGVYCVLCRAAVVYPDAKPYYALVYVNDKGVQNIWDIWMGAHSEKK